MADQHALVAAGVVQRFGGALALDHVDFELRTGEIHALLGENGAGKSTLVKVLTGALSPTQGRILADGIVRTWGSPHAATSAGVAVVHQDYHLFPALSVAENIVAARSDTPTRLKLVQRRRVREYAEQLLGGLGIDIDVRRRADSLDAAERKLVEIARALAGKPRYLFLDEPTAALEPRETERLLALMQRLARGGTGVVFVTHRLSEVLATCDRATVLRDGKVVGVVPREQMSRDRLVELIVGSEVTDHQGPSHSTGPEVLHVRGITLRPGSQPFELELGRGELVGVIGLVGSGAADLARHLAGVHPLRTAVTTLHGKPVRPTSPGAAQRLGIGYIPEDRKRSGVLPRMSIAANLALADLPRYATVGFRRGRRLSATAGELRQRYSIRCASIWQDVGDLSGGNQQKVLVGRLLSRDLEILVVEEPTQGVDIGARREIHEHLVQFARGGGSVLFVSSDLEEVRALSHRILVIHDGNMVAQYDCRSEGPPSHAALTDAMTTMSVHREAS